MRSVAIPTVLVLLLAPAALADHGGSDAEAHGKVTFSTSCKPEVQAEFEDGVALLHSFGYEPAAKLFESVAAKDPGCGMAWWGLAATYYHPLWAPPNPDELARGRAAAEKAAAVGAPTPREQAWIGTVGALWNGAPEVDHRTRIGRYRDALGALARAFPDDDEAAIFHALTLLGTAPPSDRTFAQQKQATEILTPFVTKYPDHPGVAHYMIHALDYPELANLGLDAARRYARIAPGSAHALHMPSHIFVRLGLWPEAIASNLDSAESARAAAATLPETASHAELHALDYLEYAYLQSGQDDKARGVVEAAARLAGSHKPDFAAAYAAVAIPARYALERGDWRAAAGLALPAKIEWAKYPYAEAITMFARALGAAHLDDAAGAQAAVDRLAALQARLAADPPAGPYDWASHVESLRLTAAGVLARAAGKTEEALDLLSRAADLEEKTGKHPVTPGTALPPRELYADLLLDLGRGREALDTYQAALQIAPNRLRSLYGAARAAELAGQTARARSLFNLVSAVAVRDSQRPEVVAARSRSTR